MIGQIIKVPRAISESEHIRIVGDQRHCDKSKASNWELLAVAHDVANARAFQVTEAELVKWCEEVEAAKQLVVTINGKVVYDGA